MPPLLVLAKEADMNEKAKIREDAMQIFSKEELGSVRAFKDDEGVAWFSVKDTCSILDIQNTTHATENLDADEKRVLDRNNDVTLNVMSKSRGGAQTMMFVNTSGLYTLIIRSRKPKAKAFKRWITHVVIPSILEGKNTEGASAYVYGQEDLEDPEPDTANAKTAANREALKASLQAAKKVEPPKPECWAVINGIRMTREEALNWDFD